MPDQPQIPKILVVPPADLPPRLHERFRSTVSNLGPLLLGSTSPESIARLVRLRDDERVMQATIDKEGMQVPGRRPGEMVKHRLLGPLAKVRAEIRMLENELALSPNARKRVLGKLAPPPPEDENEQAFLMRMLLTYDVGDRTGTPPPEDMARLEKLAAEGRKRRRRR